MKSTQIMLLLALLLPAATTVTAAAKPSSSSSSRSSSGSSSFKSGFSSQKSSPTSSNRSTSSKNSSFGSFGSRSSSATPPPAPQKSGSSWSQRSQDSASSGAAAPQKSGSIWSRDSTADAGKADKKGSFGGFGSFGGAPARQDSGVQQKSDSVLSQRLNKGSAEANALRTLEARRAAEQAANAPREIRPVPPIQPGGQYGSAHAGQNPAQYGNANGGQYNGGQYDSKRNGQYNGNTMPAPIIVPQNNSNGMGNAILGFLLGRSMSSSHANTGYPGNTNHSGVASTTPGASASMPAPAGTVEAPPERSLGKSMLRTFVWLVILSVVGWIAYAGWKFLRRGKAPSTANYSFDRN